MEDLSLHILDIVENSLMAGARLVEVAMEEDPASDSMAITVSDDGQGMEPQFLARATDPFVTTRTTRRVGLGLSLFKANAANWGGGLEVRSQPGQGTTVRVWFQRGHLDRPPLGDWPRTLCGLILTRQEVDFRYLHRVGEQEFELDTRELREELGPEALADPQVMALVRQQIGEALVQIGVAQVPAPPGGL
ncbi:MAG: ATP-binding protein [Desulfarculus sp.]|nr:ATP-binding protein [Desulfarculus sp.]